MKSATPQFQNLIDALDVAALPPEDQEALFLELHALVSQGSMIRLIERMDDATREEFVKLMDAGAEESAIESFLREKVPDADAAVAETVAELTDDILAVTGTNTH